MQLIFATHNAYKLSEIAAQLNNKFELKSLLDINCKKDIPETALTFDGNALLKAKYVYNTFQVPCFADDSGLCVKALNNEPGIYSARYAGEEKDDIKNMEKLLKNLKSHSDRSSYFKTSICLYLANNNIHYFEGIINGTINDKVIGSHGFGYDPIFTPDGYNYTFAELGNEIKNKISHRAIAFNKLINYLNDIK